MTAHSYGRDVQLLLAGIDPAALTAAGVRIQAHTYDEQLDFVKSKCSVDEESRTIHVHEFVTDRDASGQPRQVRVKVKSGESLLEHFAPTAGADPIAARRDVTGTDLINAWLQQAVAESTDPQAAARAASVTVEQDSLAAAGQDWVVPFESAWTDSDGAVHLQSRSMFVASTHPLPAGFTPPPGVLGVHYVTVPTPQLLAQIVAGTGDLPRIDTDPAPSYGPR